MVKTRAANRPPALALADSAQHSGTPGARAHQRKNFNRAAAVAPALAGGLGEPALGCCAGVARQAQARQQGRAVGAGAHFLGGGQGNAQQTGRGVGAGGAGWVGTGVFPQPGGPFVGLRGHAAKPHLGHAEAGLPPLASRGSAMRVGAAEDRATSHNAANSPSTQVRRWR